MVTKMECPKGRAIRLSKTLPRAEAWWLIRKEMRLRARAFLAATP